MKPVPGKLFLVGDPKQSIYRFRRADVALYEEVKERLLSVGAELLYLTTSFRALRPIQECVNAAFDSEMQDDAAAGQAAGCVASLHEGGAGLGDGLGGIVVDGFQVCLP